MNLKQKMKLSAGILAALATTGGKLTALGNGSDKRLVQMPQSAVTVGIRSSKSRATFLLDSRSS